MAVFSHRFVRSLYRGRAGGEGIIAWLEEVGRSLWYENLVDGFLSGHGDA